MAEFIAPLIGFGFVDEGAFGSVGKYNGPGCPHPSIILAEIIAIVSVKKRAENGIGFTMIGSFIKVLGV